MGLKGRNTALNPSFVICHALSCVISIGKLQLPTLWTQFHAALSLLKHHCNIIYFTVVLLQFFNQLMLYESELQLCGIHASGIFMQLLAIKKEHNKENRQKSKWRFMRSCCYLCVPCPIATRQEVHKHVPSAISIHAIIEELLNIVFSMQSMLYQVLGM
jgi:hypothetical protein